MVMEKSSNPAAETRHELPFSSGVSVQQCGEVSLNLDLKEANPIGRVPGGIQLDISSMALDAGVLVVGKGIDKTGSHLLLSTSILIVERT